MEAMATQGQTDRSRMASFETGHAENNAESGTFVQHISFAVDGELYGVDIMAVREIKAWTEVTVLPRQPDYVRGVLNLRGVVVPIFDLRCRFGNGRTEATPIHVIIIVQIHGKLVGLLVDRVSDILSTKTTDIQSVPSTSQADDEGLLSGLVAVDGHMIALLDLERVGGQLIHASDESEE